MSPDLSREQRAARRALLRQHHPDLGGDADRFVEVLAAIESPVSDPARRAPTGARRRRSAVRRMRTRLPRGVPGARRFATY